MGISALTNLTGPNIPFNMVRTFNYRNTIDTTDNLILIPNNALACQITGKITFPYGATFDGTYRQVQAYYNPVGIAGLVYYISEVTDRRPLIAGQATVMQLASGMLDVSTANNDGTNSKTGGQLFVEWQGDNTVTISVGVASFFSIDWYGYT